MFLYDNGGVSGGGCGGGGGGGGGGCVCVFVFVCLWVGGGRSSAIKCESDTSFYPLGEVLRPLGLISEV